MNIDQPIISVCIPTYNAAKFIKKTIKSVLNSTYSNFEIIISDDASTDNTIEIIEEIKDKRISLIKNNKNSGVPKNWNRTIKEARGEYIGLLNHDDLYGPFWLTFAANILNKNKHIGWVSTAFNIINENDKIIDFNSCFPETRECSLIEAFINIAKLDGLGPGFIARQTVLEEVNFYDNNIGPGADNDLFLRMACKFPLYYSSFPHTFWRFHEDNLTKKWAPIDQALEGFKMLKKVFDNNNLPIEIQKHKTTCFRNYYFKILAHSEELKGKGDIKSFKQLSSLLKSYKAKFIEKNNG